MILLGDLLDLIDQERESEEEVAIMNHNGEYDMRAKVCWDGWEGIEDRMVNSIHASEGTILVWLEDKCFSKGTRKEE